MRENALHFANVLLILVVLIDLFVLGTSRLNAIIRAAALQGGLLAALPLALHGLGPELLLLAVGTLAIKAIAVPRMMLWAIREATIRREIDPLLGFVPSLMLAGVGIGLSFALARQLPLRDPAAAAYLVPAALSTVFCGLLLIVTRKKAITQVAGFLVMENGVYLIGLLLAAVMPWMVEAGVLLDLFAAIFVMGIVVYHINREFSSTDTAKLTSLRD
ncbi:MAG: hydrogenase [Myxococcales bacterium]